MDTTELKEQVNRRARMCDNCEHRAVSVSSHPCEPCFGTETKPNYEPKVIKVIRKLSDPERYVRNLQQMEVEEQPVGKKFDGDKPPMALLETEWLEGVARVLAFGAKKYAADNWRQGLEIRRLISAAMRHIGAFNKGIDLDEETGESHLYHASCCLMFASWLMTHKPELDDRYKA